MRSIVQFSRLFLPIITLVLLLSCGTTGEKLENTMDDNTVISNFKNPNTDAKPMVRMWFPDAGAGEDPNDLIEKQILELAEKGFGGVEIAMLADGVNYDNSGGKIYGWGTTNWKNLLKKVLKAAEKVPGGFQVDMTITAHWPPTLNTLDPNDEAANKELSYSITKINRQNISNNLISLQLPVQRLDGPKPGFRGAKSYDHFLFTDTFLSATIAKVSRINMISNEENTNIELMPQYIFDFNSLKTITNTVSSDRDGGYAAGVPDEATANIYGWNYNEILEFFGPESDGPWISNNGKLDEELNRKRMADWQNQYTADLTDVSFDGINSNSEIIIGDWVVISTFSRGTGQSIPGGRIMHNGVFVTNYFNKAGTTSLTDFWDNMMANDPELLELMRSNKGYIFEDSIEASSQSSYWASTIMEDTSDNYLYKDIMPLVAAGQFLSSGFMSTTLTKFYDFENDNGLIDRIYEDYSDKLAELYTRYRVTGMVDWSAESFGWGFRGQTYHLPGLEISRAAMVADVAECDNMSKGDGVRYQAATVNISKRDFLTMEAITGPSIGYVTMDDIMTEVGQNYSDGVNRVILHGAPYTKSFNGYNSDWPGWLPFGPSFFGSAYTYRQAYWDDVTTETDYMSRIQAVLQKGEAKIDLAVLIDKEHTYDFESGNRFQDLLDSGLSYNLISEATLNHPNAVVLDKRLASDGPSYKALIVDRVEILSIEVMKKLTKYAASGLPIIVYNSDINRVFGSNVENDSLVKDEFIKLINSENVHTTKKIEDLKTLLSDLGFTSYAQYYVPQLETTMYMDTIDGTNYYYIFNNAYPENSGMMGNDQSTFYKTPDKIVKNAIITLSGNGVPYKLDPHTGTINQVAEYSVGKSGLITFEIDELAGGDAVIYAITSDKRNFPAETEYVVNVKQTTDDYSIVRNENKLALRSNSRGDYTIKKSDGSLKTLEIAETLGEIDLSSSPWNLIIHSYGSSENNNDPSSSNITTVDFITQRLGKWNNIVATTDQLLMLGVENMRNVSGVGEYSTTFTLPGSWNENTGAYLDFRYGKDQIGSYTINGVTIKANNISDRVDLFGLLVSGKNTLTIKLSTSLYGRMFVENSGYSGTEFGMSSGFMSPIDPDGYYNGLLSAILVPYTQIDLD